MHRKSLLAGFVAGAATVVAMMILSSAGRTMPRAMAQVAQPQAERPGVLVDVVKAEVGQGQPPDLSKATGVMTQGGSPAVPAAGSPRYQISAVGSVSAPGALIIDTQTGVIWRYINEGTPLRKVAKVPSEQ